MARPTVLITDYNYPDLAIEREALARWNATLVAAQCTTPQAVLEAGKNADGLISQYAPITKEVIRGLTRCRALGRYGIGVDNIDVPAATERGIAVINVPSYCEDEVSDHALAMLLAWVRRVPHYAQEVRAGVWDWKTGRPIRRLRGQVLGLLGFGKIARVLAEKAKVLGLVTIAHDPYLAVETFAQADVEQVKLDDLLSRSDFLSVHVPCTPTTRHLLGKTALSKMKPTACLINTSRGPVVDEAALIEALERGSLAGACLDVMEREPPEAGSRLLQLPNVLLSPHVAWYSDESLIELRHKVADDVGRALAGSRPHGLVNHEVAGQFQQP